MNTLRFALAGMLVALLSAPLTGKAADIDIYDKPNGSAMPNVMIVLDNAANFSASAGTCAYDDAPLLTPTLSGTAGGYEQCALNNVINSLPTNADGTARINIGFMVYNANSFTAYGCSSGGNGGCLIKRLAAMTAVNKAAMMAWIKGWQTSGNATYPDGTPTNIKASGEATAAAVQETWAYYSGKHGMSGRDYEDIKPSLGCQSDFMIFIGNAFTTSGTPSDGGSSSPSGALAGAPNITTAQKAIIKVPSGCYGIFSGTSTGFVSGSTCPTTTSPYFSCGMYSMPNHTDSSGLYADEWTRYMNQTDVNGVQGGTQKITTYTVGLLGSSCKSDYPAIMSSMATVGGGKYFATSSYDDIVAALRRILNEIQSVNSAFSSASLPVSVNAQGSYNNQVFIGMFRPDPTGSPRWLGNMKQYQFIGTGNAIKLGDSLGNAAISSAGTGFFSPDAVSFWTSKDTSVAPDKTGGFWINQPSGVAVAFDSPDGEKVEKGGAAQRQRIDNLIDNYTTSPGSPRNLYTFCPSNTSCVTPMRLGSDPSNVFATTNTAITSADLGVASASARTALINWVRGQDNAGDELGPGAAVATVRPSIHGDVLHSRPVVIDFGGSTGVVIFYGANDGVFRAVNGNQTAAIGSVPAGSELWGLVLPDFYGKLNRLRTNSPLLLLPSTNPLITPTPTPKDYFVDGATGLYQTVNSTGTTVKAILYLSMRRGGRFIYAIDVSTPTDPVVLWRKSSTDPDYSELGQSWSSPKITVVKGYKDATSGKPKPVLIFGAGYDAAAEDSEPPSADTMGRGIFIVDAMDGHVVRSFTPTGMNSIAADITFLDRDFDGYVETLYAADTGGNIWRVDLEPGVLAPLVGTDPANWKVTKFAALGCDGGTCAAGTTPRKFLYPPSVVPIGAPGYSTSYNAVTIGSGDREHPTYNTSTNSAYNVTNRIYILKDMFTGNDAGTTVLTQSDLFDATTTPYDGSKTGFYITLVNKGEKAVNAALTTNGIIFLGTNQAIAPSTTSCSSTLGIARSYSIDLFGTGYGSVVLDGGGLPPGPITGTVNMTTTNADGTTTTTPTQFCLGCIQSASGPGAAGGTANTNCVKSALENCKLPANLHTKTMRTYWYKK